MGAVRAQTRSLTLLPLSGLATAHKAPCDLTQLEGPPLSLGTRPPFTLASFLSLVTTSGPLLLLFLWPGILSP